MYQISREPLHRRTEEDPMPRTNLTFPTGLVLQAIARGHRYGFEIIEMSGLTPGTVYPALRRLEGAGYLSSAWEEESDAAAHGRPPRCYYGLTPAGSQLLARILERFPAVALSLGTGPSPEPESA
jgi:PadR family transcriptional regulator PadR